jgi:hypothetical protein
MSRKSTPRYLSLSVGFWFLIFLFRFIFYFPFSRFIIYENLSYFGIYCYFRFWPNAFCVYSLESVPFLFSIFVSRNQSIKYVLSVRLNFFNIEILLVYIYITGINTISLTFFFSHCIFSGFQSFRSTKQ